MPKNKRSRELDDLLIVLGEDKLATERLKKALVERIASYDERTLGPCSCDDPKLVPCDCGDGCCDDPECDEPCQAEWCANCRKPKED